MLLTVNIQPGSRLAGKKHDKILEAVLAVFLPETVKVVQVGYDVICVTFLLLRPGWGSSHHSHLCFGPSFRGGRGLFRIQSLWEH